MNTTEIRKIRFGIMCSSLDFPKWQADTIAKLLEHDNIECSLLIFDKRSSTGIKTKDIFKAIKFKNILWKLYFSFAKKSCKSDSSVDLNTLLQNVPAINCQIRKKGKFSEYFTESDIAEIESYNLDFILRFGFGIIRGKVLKSAKYGVWSFHHGDEQKYRGVPPCFWEIYHNDNITGTILQRLTHKLDGGIVLKKGFLKTEPSYVKNRDQMFFESSKWPLQVCKDIMNGNTNYLQKEPSKTTAAIFYAPTNFQFIKFFIKSSIKRLTNSFRKLTFVDYWNIGVANAPIDSYLEKDNHLKINWLPNLPKNRFFADPFALVDGNKLHIFYEDYPFLEQKGNIAYMSYENGEFSTPQTVINEKFHLSYPYVFKANGDIYMVPESYEAGQVLLYKAVEFPLKWKKDRVLIDNFSGVDSTLIQHNDTWWMFTTDRNVDTTYNLNLFYADSLLDEWKPHPQNPIKTDIRSARSAGTPFVWNGELFRPSMDYSKKVEGSITINKVLNITKEKYHEIKQNEVGPSKNTFFSDKIHTLAEANGYTVIDGCKEAFIFTNVNFIKHKMKTILRKMK